MHACFISFKRLLMHAYVCINCIVQRRDEAVEVFLEERGYKDHEVSKLLREIGWTAREDAVGRIQKGQPPSS